MAIFNLKPPVQTKPQNPATKPPITATPPKPVGHTGMDKPKQDFSNGYWGTRPDSTLNQFGQPIYNAPAQQRPQSTTFGMPSMPNIPSPVQGVRPYPSPQPAGPMQTTQPIGPRESIGASLQGMPTIQPTGPRENLSGSIRPQQGALAQALSRPQNNRRPSIFDMLG